MVKQISKIGNSQGIIFDSTLMQMARLNVGDEVNIEIHDSGAITITPMAADHPPTAEQIDDVIEATMEDYATTMKKLA